MERSRVARLCSAGVIAYRCVCEMTEREKKHLLSEVIQIRGLMPLLMKPRPTIEQPIFDADAVGPEVPAKIGGGSGESAVKAAIEADGYKRAKVVRQGDNGIWYAKAMRGTTEVSLTVDAGGRVSLE